MVDLMHGGLFFSEQQLTTARKYAGRVPFAAAWGLLRGAAHPPFTPAEGLPTAQWDGLRYRLDGDQNAGERAVLALGDLPFTPDDLPYAQAAAHTLIYAQCLTLVQDHPALAARWPAQQAHLSERITALNQPDFALTLVDTLWQAAMNMAAGIVLGREPLVTAAAQVYRDTIDTEVHPEGYFPKIVQAGADSLAQQVQAVKALVLLAEMAAHAGGDLWPYHRRGVSVLTAATYSLYYYFYPEKWQWEPGLDLDDAAALFRQHGGFLEIINGRYEKPLRAVRLILKDLRPIYDFTAGGLTGLTHGVPERRGLFR